MTRREWLMLLSVAGLTRLPGRRATSRATGGAPPCLRGGHVRWLVGWSAGGGYDAYVRLAEPLLERSWGVPIAVDNQPGAGGRVAAAALARARADGRTIGLLDAPGILWWSASGDTHAVHLERDFTLLARIARTIPVVAASARSGIRTLDDLTARPRRRLLFGSTAPGSQNFVASAVAARLLDLDADFVTGYPGSREVLLGLMRGDFDLVALNAETLVDHVRSGAAIPLGTVNPGAADIPDLAGVPDLSDPATLRRLRPALAGAGEPAFRLADAIRAYSRAGRIIAAPHGLPDEMRRCLEDGLRTVLTDDGFRTTAARAQRSLDLAFGDAMMRDVAAAREAAGALVAVAMDAQRRSR